MGYRAEWLNHAYGVSRHYEIVIHAIERNFPKQPVRMLYCGVENGGDIEVWQKALPKGSVVVGVDVRPECGSLPIDVRVGDVLDEGFVRGEFKDQWFDLIFDSTGAMSPYLWPFLRPGGLWFLEGYDLDVIVGLLRGLQHDEDEWLPMEEVMHVDAYQRVCIIEKRNPHVLPYIEVMVGNFADVVSEKELIASGAKRVLV